MTNHDAAAGLKLCCVQTMGGFTGKLTPYVAVAGYATALFVGDLVKLAGTAATNEEGLSLQSVEQAAAGDTACGVIVSIGVNPDNLNRIYRPASTLQTVYVCDDPYALYEMQTASGTALTETMIGNNADIVVSAGSTATGLSGIELDLTTVGTGSAQIRIIQLLNGRGNEYAEHAKVICMINEHAYKGTAGF